MRTYSRRSFVGNNMLATGTCSSAARALLPAMAFFVPLRKRRMIPMHSPEPENIGNTHASSGATHAIPIFSSEERLTERLSARSDTCSGRVSRRKDTMRAPASIWGGSGSGLGTFFGVLSLSGNQLPPFFVGLPHLVHMQIQPWYSVLYEHQ